MSEIKRPRSAGSTRIHCLPTTTQRGHGARMLLETVLGYGRSHTRSEEGRQWLHCKGNRLAAGFGRRSEGGRAGSRRAAIDVRTGVGNFLGMTTPRKDMLAERLTAVSGVWSGGKGGTGGDVVELDWSFPARRLFRRQTKRVFFATGLSGAEIAASGLSPTRRAMGGTCTGCYPESGSWPSAVSAAWPAPPNWDMEQGDVTPFSPQT